MENDKVRKDKNEVLTPEESGNIRSTENMGPCHPWTDDEMNSSKPIPLPTVEPIEHVNNVTGILHSGNGKTKAGGRPENDNIK